MIVCTLHSAGAGQEAKNVTSSVRAWQPFANVARVGVLYIGGCDSMVITAGGFDFTQQAIYTFSSHFRRFFFFFF